MWPLRRSARIDTRLPYEFPTQYLPACGVDASRYDAGSKLVVLVFVDNRNERSKVSTKGRIHQRPASDRTRKPNLPEHRLIKPLNWEISLRRLCLVD